MEIFCNIGDPRLNTAAEIVIRNAAETALSVAEGKEIPRIVLSFREEDGGEDDIMILLYKGERAPIFLRPAGGVLRSPYSIAELEALVRKLILETSKEREPCSGANEVKEESAPQVQLFGRRVSLGETSVVLTKTEAAVFAVLYENRGMPVSREQLAERVWGGEVKTNLCDVYVCRLRASLEPVFGKGFLVNLRNEGYMMV